MNFGNTMFPSWPGLTRPSTAFFHEVGKDVDARDKRGHDAEGWR
jgi:hypothetical protein